MQPPFLIIRIRPTTSLQVLLECNMSRPSMDGLQAIQQIIFNSLAVIEFQPPKTHRIDSLLT
jgi:hypothetical protein